MRKTNSTHRMKLFGIDDMLLGAGLGLLGNLFTNSTNSDNIAATNAQNSRNVALANQTNLEISKNTNEMAIQQSAINREYQERLSNSAYQRGMDDMKKAGLNPILAYQKGGASSPSGIQAALQTPHMSAAAAQPFQMSNPLAEAANTGMAMRRSAQEIQNMRYTQDQIEQSTAESVSRENINKAELQHKAAELPPKEREALKAKIDIPVYNTKFGTAARSAGTYADEVKRTTDPIINSATKLWDSFKPGIKYTSEKTSSGSTWKDPMTGENHYQDRVFNQRWPQ